MRIISIDGGGYLGLATASFLSAIEQRFGVKAADQFDLFCGTSTGAIIALALASGKSASEIKALYKDFGPAVFKRPPFLYRRFPRLRLLRAVQSALYDNTPLKEALGRTFGDLTLGDLRKREKLVLATAFNVTTGTPKIFKTDHGPNLRAHDQYLVRDVALASSAAPMYLPLVELADPLSGSLERFCDGGIVSNSPALLGFAEAVSHLRRAPGDVSILSLATPRLDHAERTSSLKGPQRKLARGLYGWDLGERIFAVTIDGGTLVADSALKRIAKASGSRYCRVPLHQPDGLALDNASPEATATLEHLGTERANESEIVSALATFFTSTDAEAR